MSEAIAKRGVDTPVSALNKLLLANQKQIEMALPKHLRPERLIRLAVTAMNTAYGLQDCSMLSIANSVMMAAQLGLEPNSGLGHGWLIPYGKVCSFQVGYRGLLELAYRTGNLRDANAIVVYDKEEFVYEEGQNLRFVHKPLPPSLRGEQWIGCYSRLTFKDGASSTYWMWREEIEEVRDKSSRTKEKGPWVIWFWEMVKKTVIKRHLKMAQLSNEIGLAVGNDDQAEAYATDEPTRHKPEVVQDMVLDGSIIDQARQADEALAAGSHEEQQAVAQKKLKVSKEEKKDPLEGINPFKEYDHAVAERSS